MQILFVLWGLDYFFPSPFACFHRRGAEYSADFIRSIMSLVLSSLSTLLHLPFSHIDRLVYRLYRPVCQFQVYLDLNFSSSPQNISCFGVGGETRENSDFDIINWISLFVVNSLVPLISFWRNRKSQLPRTISTLSFILGRGKHLIRTRASACSLRALPTQPDWVWRPFTRRGTSMCMFPVPFCGPSLSRLYQFLYFTYFFISPPVSASAYFSILFLLNWFGSIGFYLLFCVACFLFSFLALCSRAVFANTLFNWSFPNSVSAISSWTAINFGLWAWNDPVCVFSRALTRFTFFISLECIACPVGMTLSLVTLGHVLSTATHISKG